MEPPNQLLRESIEKSIIDALEAIELDQDDTDWSFTPQYAGFRERWKTLIGYHRQHADPCMGLALLDIYLEKTEILRALFREDNFSATTRERVWDLNKNIEYWMNE